MASRLVRKAFLQSPRPRSTCIARSRCDSSFGLVRRHMASSHGEGSAKSDMPWIVVSGVVTLAGSAYLLTPPSKEAAHHAASRSEPSFPSFTHPAKESEEKESEEPAAEDKSSSNEPAQQDKESKDDKGEEDSSTEDDKSSSEESQDDNTESSEKSSKDDSSRFDDGAPGQTSASEKGPEQVVKPKQKTGTIKENDDQGPTDLGDARKLSKEKDKVPASAKKDSKDE